MQVFITDHSNIKHPVWFPIEHTVYNICTLFTIITWLIDMAILPSGTLNSGVQVVYIIYGTSDIWWFYTNNTQYNQPKCSLQVYKRTRV